MVLEEDLNYKFIYWETGTYTLIHTHTHTFFEIDMELTRLSLSQPVKLLLLCKNIEINRTYIVGIFVEASD